MVELRRNGTGAPVPGSVNWMRRVAHLHFVGVGGAGMSGIAEVLANLGYRVTGTDLRESATTARLGAMGVGVRLGHEPRDVQDADVVVVSSAVQPDNPEVRWAREHRVPVVPRAQMLAELMRFRQGIAVAGTHGKTTTTSLVASVLAEGGYDPTFVIGGRLNSAGASARLGSGQFLVAEADESDASFLHLMPVVAVVTNVDVDHMGTYEGDFERLRQAFADFLKQLPFYGLAVLCLDDPVLREMAPALTRPVLSYGEQAGADVRARDITADGHRTRFQVELPGEAAPVPVTLNLPGRHNVLNALAAIAVAHELGVAVDAIQRALAVFDGIGRRFQVHGEALLGAGRALVVDDYAHHPTEIAATLAAARAGWPGRRLLVAFQPHRYTRTHDLLDDFARVLSEADALVLLDVYAAGEEPIPGADSRALARAIRGRGRIEPVLVHGLDEGAAALGALAADGDLLLLLGAGDIGTLPGRLLREPMGPGEGP